MPQTTGSFVQSNFTGGLKTEQTGLNFPENSCTEATNVVFDLIGNVYRRAGFDFEDGFNVHPIERTNKAISTYKWNNVGGDGLTQLLVQQVGSRVYFFSISSSTIADPLSSQESIYTINLSDFLAQGLFVDPGSIECQFTDGNGYLFIFHPNCEPIYCTYNAGAIIGAPITIQIRDFTGIPEFNVPDNLRPSSLSSEHKYNLNNQGWTSGQTWSAGSSDLVPPTSGVHAFTVASGIVGISPGQSFTGLGHYHKDDGSYPDGVGVNVSGLVVSYSGTTLTLNITSTNDIFGGGFGANNWSFNSTNTNNIGTWFTAAGNYPSNSDVWWLFKDSTGAFNPGTTISQVSFASSKAPRGSFILSAFTQQRSLLSGVAGLTDITTTVRPKTGTWFQGRIWYTGVDASFAATGDAPYSTWSENLYFSQVVTTISDFGKCYQTNDPTSEDFFDLLPTDGGVISIQGCGSIYRLFPVQNGLLVFASNGIWFITGSQGIGFSATDYTITKISSVQSITCDSFVNVLGWPFFWNEEGIYSVHPSQQGGGLQVDNICYGTILTFYNDIPLQSKKFVKGDYNPITFIMSWVYRSTNETDVTSRYQYDSVLNFNTANKAFYPYSVSAGPSTTWIHSINYVAGPGGSTSPDPVFKYTTSSFVSGQYYFTFSEEKNTDYIDWFLVDQVGVDYDSSFTAGYNLHGKALVRWQPQYVYVYSDNTTDTSYRVQGLFDYASSGNSGRYSQLQLITNDVANFKNVFRRHRIRGRGLVFQLRIQSVSGQPFSIFGWSLYENINQGQ